MKQAHYVHAAIWLIVLVLLAAATMLGQEQTETVVGNHLRRLSGDFVEIARLNGLVATLASLTRPTSIL